MTSSPFRALGYPPAQEAAIAAARPVCEAAGGTWSDSPLGCANVPVSANLPYEIPVVSTSYRSWWIAGGVGAVLGAALGAAVMHAQMTREQP
jgi:hypothetical protein